MNLNSAENEIKIRDNIMLKIHPDSREPFEYFCFRDAEMVAELDFFIEQSKGCKYFLDIGALHGIFALTFVKSEVGRSAIAIDASSRAFARLIYNVHKNQLQREITTVECALSNEDGHLPMNYTWEHAIAAGPGENGSSDVLVPMTTGDRLCQQFGFLPDAVKIDVEGHEVKVLQGLLSTIKTRRPLIFLEVHPSMIQRQGDNPNQIAEIFESLEYERIIPGGEIAAPAGITQNSGVYRALYRPVNTPNALGPVDRT